MELTAGQAECANAHANKFAIHLWEEWGREGGRMEKEEHATHYYVQQLYDL